MAKSYQVGVIGRTGHGDYGHGLDVVWKEIPECQVVAVADDDPVGLAAAGKRLGVEQAYRDYREMLEKTPLDILAICPRWIDQHHAMAMAAAERGLHIYLEKPFCQTLEQADEIVAACQRTHSRLVIAHQTRFSPRIDVVKKLIADGKLGRVVEFRGRGKEDHRGGGEDLWVLGSHIMDLIRIFGGHPQWCFASVTEGGRPIAASDVKPGAEGLGPLAGDAVRAMYGMPDGATAYFQSHRGVGNGKRFGLQIFGSAGVCEIMMGYHPTVKFLADPAWSPGRSGAKWQNVTSAGIDQPEPRTDQAIPAGNVMAVRELLSAIEENREPAGGVEDARGATEMILAVFESQRQGKPVTLPLENRKHPLDML